MSILSILHSLPQYLTVGAIASGITWLLAARNKTLENRKLKLEIARLTEEAKPRQQDRERRERLEAVCQKIISVAKEASTSTPTGVVTLFDAEDLSEACGEPVPEILKALRLLEAQDIADPNFSEGSWRIRT